MPTSNGPQSVASETFAGASPVSGLAPTLASDGQPVSDLTAVSVWLLGAGGINLSGAGTLLCYLYDPDVGLWARSPNNDISLSTSGVAAVQLDTFDVTAPRNGRVKWVPSGVTFASGTAGVTVIQTGYVKKQQGLYK